MAAKMGMKVSTQGLISCKPFAFFALFASFKGFMWRNSVLSFEYMSLQTPCVSLYLLHQFHISLLSIVQSLELMLQHKHFASSDLASQIASAADRIGRFVHEHSIKQL